MPSPVAGRSYSIASSSGANGIDSLLIGTSWASGIGASATLTYSFANSTSRWSLGANEYGSGSGAEPFTGYNFLSAAQKTAAVNALREWENYANVRFEPITANAEETADLVGDIRFARTTLLANGTPESGHADYPGPRARDGDIWLQRDVASNNQLNPGQFGYQTLLHEIGHALGLKHPHDDSPNLPTDKDSYSFSVMSYKVSADKWLTPWSSNVYPTTAMWYDIQAIQWLYGVNTSYRSGDDVYTFNQGQNYWQTIWDAGGVDTIVWNASTQAVTIRLEPGSWSTLGNPIVMTNTTSGATFTQPDTVIIYGTVSIENAYGGAAGDTLLGNGTHNLLRGNGGRDTLKGGNGDDRLEGGAAGDILQGDAGSDSLNGGDVLDVAFFDSALGQNTITRSVGETRITGPEGTDVLKSVERLQFTDVLWKNLDLLRDFNNDGYEDLLFRNKTTGTIEMKVLNDAGQLAPIVAGNVVKSGVSPSWRVNAGDFNDDGHADLLLNHLNGSVVYWEMSNAVQVDSVTVRSGISPDWKMRIVDLTGDGHADLFLNHTNGAVVLWEMRNGRVVGSSTVREGLSSDWNIQTADFNGDGQADIFLNHQNGAVVLWEMKSGRIASSTTIREGLSPSWNILTGDLSGDGRSDLLLHHTNGSLVQWTMAGDRIADSTTLSTTLTNVSSLSVRHVSGDSEADIVVRKTDASLTLWHMSQSQVLNTVDLGGGSHAPATWDML